MEPRSKLWRGWKRDTESRRPVNPVWWLYCCLVSILIPDYLLKRAGYWSQNGRDRFREKLGIVSLYIFINIFCCWGLDWILMHPGRDIRIPMKLGGNWIAEESFVIIRGEVYPAEKLDLSGDEFPFGSSDLILDATFLDQDRDDVCDEFWGAKGNGTYFPCLPLNLLNSTIFSRPETQPNINLCLSNHEEKQARRAIPTARYMTYDWNQIQKKDRWVTYRGQVLDLMRLKYIHRRLETSQAAWFKEIRGVLFDLEPESSDIDHLMHHHTTREQRELFESCVTPILRVGYLEEMPFLTWFSNIFLVGVATTVFGWFCIGTYVLLLQKVSGKAFGEWILVNWRGGPTLPVSRSYFGSQFKRSTDSHLSIGQEVQSKMTRKDFDLVVLNKGGFPNTVQFDPSELNRGMHHLAQTEPDYEFVDNLDFEPLRTVILIPSNGRTSPRRLASTVRSAAESRYPATHKLVVVVLDGDAPPEILSLFCDFVVPRHATKSSAYLATAEAPYSYNKARVYAGYYQYANNEAFTARPRPASHFSSRATSRTYNPVQSKELQVPLLVICKEGNQEEKGSLGQGMRGQRDSVQLVLGFFQRIFFNGPLCPLDFDLATLIKAVTGVSAEYFSLLATLTPGAKLAPTALIDLVRPFTQSRDVAAVGSPLTYHATTGLTRVARVVLAFFSGWANPLAAMGSECLLLPRECSVYRLWSPPGFTNSFLEVEAFSSSCQPILLHPNVLRSYIRPAKKSLFASLVEEWFEDGFLTLLIQRRLPQKRILILSESVCSVALPFSSRGWLRFACVTWLKHLFGLVARVADLKAWWGVRVHCLFLLGLLTLTPTILTAFIAGAVRLAQAPVGPALLHITPFMAAIGIPCIFIILLLATSLCQKRLRLAQRWCDFLVSLTFLPVCAVLVPLLALWNSDKISLKFYYSGSGPSFKFMKPPPSSLDVTKSPASFHLSLASPGCFSPLPPSVLASDASVQCGFDWRFREELVHRHALPQALMDMLGGRIDISEIELACLVPFRYFPDWQAMLAYFRPDICQSQNNSVLLKGRAYIPSRTLYNEPTTANQKVHSISSLFYLDAISSRGGSTHPPSPNT